MLNELDMVKYKAVSPYCYYDSLVSCGKSPYTVPSVIGSPDSFYEYDNRFKAGFEATKLAFDTGNCGWWCNNGFLRVPQDGNRDVVESVKYLTKGRLGRAVGHVSGSAFAVVIALECEGQLMGMFHRLDNGGTVIRVDFDYTRFSLYLVEGVKDLSPLLFSRFKSDEHAGVSPFSVYSVIDLEDRPQEVCVAVDKYGLTAVAATYAGDICIKSKSNDIPSGDKFFGIKDNASGKLLFMGRCM